MSSSFVTEERSSIYLESWSRAVDTKKFLMNDFCMRESVIFDIFDNFARIMSEGMIRLGFWYFCKKCEISGKINEMSTFCDTWNDYRRERNNYRRGTVGRASRDWDKGSRDRNTALWLVESTFCRVLFVSIEVYGGCTVHHILLVTIVLPKILFLSKVLSIMKGVSFQTLSLLSDLSRDSSRSLNSKHRARVSCCTVVAHSRGYVFRPM